VCNNLSAVIFSMVIRWYDDALADIPQDQWQPVHRVTNDAHEWVQIGDGEHAVVVDAWTPDRRSLLAKDAALLCFGPAVTRETWHPGSRPTCLWEQLKGQGIALGMSKALLSEDAPVSPDLGLNRYVADWMGGKHPRQWNVLSALGTAKDDEIGRRPVYVCNETGESHNPDLVLLSAREALLQSELLLKQTNLLAILAAGHVGRMAPQEWRNAMNALCWGGDSAAVELLLMHANDEVRGHPGHRLALSTALTFLIDSRPDHQAGCIARLLLNAGAPLDSLDGIGLTPLERAGMRGRDDLAQILLDAGAGWDTGRPKCPELRRQQAQWELDIEAAMQRRDVQAVDALLRRSEARDGFPERHQAMRLRALRVLFRPATEAEKQLSRSAVQAVNDRDLVALKRLLTADTLHMTGDHGAAALIAACLQGDAKSVSYLLKLEASALRPDASGRCPWQVAQLPAVAGRVAGHAVTQALAQRPVSRALLDRLRLGVHDASARRKLADAIWALDLQQAAAQDDPAAIAHLLSLDGSEVLGKRRDKAASAVLCDALQATPVRDTAVKALLAGGVNINSRASDGKTPLLVACQKADVAMASRLIGAGATIDTLPWDGYDALGHACRAGSVDLVRLLLKSGASAQARDNMGFSAKDLAREFLEISPSDDPLHADRVQVLAVLEQHSR
jgi:ankyrin repeat protein